MLDILNVIFAAAVVISNISLYSDADTTYPRLGEVTKVSFHREWWRDDSKCQYRGVMVGFERDWDEVENRDGLEIVHPAEPGQRAGFAHIINRKDCPGVEPELMLRVATSYAALFGNRMVAEYRITADDLASLPENTRPRWLKQVSAVIDQDAATNPVAKEFLDFSAKSAAAKTAPIAEQSPIED